MDITNENILVDPELKEFFEEGLQHYNSKIKLQLLIKL